MTHMHLTAPIAGYACDSVHLPYVLDPLHDRYGPRARLWLAEVFDPELRGPNRVVANAWTSLDEWERPAWVGSEADRRVRLRLALMAAAEAHPTATMRGRLRGLDVSDLSYAAAGVERICEDARREGLVPQAICLAAMAVRAAARVEAGHPRLVDRASRHYGLDAWYAALAAVCACVNLSGFADAAVEREVGGVRRQALRHSQVAV